MLLAAACDCCSVGRLIGNAAARSWTRLDMTWSGCGGPWTKLLSRRGTSSRSLLLLNRLFRYGLFRRGKCWALSKSCCTVGCTLQLRLQRAMLCVISCNVLCHVFQMTFLLARTAEVHCMHPATCRRASAECHSISAEPHGATQYCDLTVSKQHAIDRCSQTSCLPDRNVHGRLPSDNAP